MSFIKWTTVAALALVAGSHALPGAWAQTQAQATAPAAGSKNIIAWAAKPAKLPPFIAPNKLVWRLADVLAALSGCRAAVIENVETRLDVGGDKILGRIGGPCGGGSRKTKTQRARAEQDSSTMHVDNPSPDRASGGP